MLQVFKHQEAWIPLFLVDPITHQHFPRRKNLFKNLHTAITLYGHDDEDASFIIVKSRRYGRYKYAQHEIEIYHHLQKGKMHPAILPFISAFDRDDSCHLVFPYGGVDLFECLKSGFVFSYRVLAHLIQRISSALFFLQCRRLVYGDLKLENILVQMRPPAINFVLFDFDLTKFMIRGQDYAISNAGTPGYLSLQRLRSCKLRVSDDMFSLGVLIFMALTGRESFWMQERHFNQRNQQQASALLCSLCFSNGWSKAQVDNIVALFEGLIEYQGDQRLPLAAVLEWPWLQETPVSAPTTEPKPPIRLRRRSN